MFAARYFQVSGPVYVLINAYVHFNFPILLIFNFLIRLRLYLFPNATYSTYAQALILYFI